MDANAPEISSQEEASTTFKVKVNLVEVRVVVRDAYGKAVGNLKQEDFQLTDNGKPQIISKFSVEQAASQPFFQAGDSGDTNRRRWSQDAGALHRLPFR